MNWLPVLCQKLPVGGVQSQSLTVDRQMSRYNVPRVAFINKCDRVGADPARVIGEIEAKLGHVAVPLQIPIGLEGHHEGVVDLVAMKAVCFDGPKGEDVRVADDHRRPAGSRPSAGGTPCWTRFRCTATS